MLLVRIPHCRFGSSVDSYRSLVLDTGSCSTILNPSFTLVSKSPFMRQWTTATSAWHLRRTLALACFLYTKGILGCCAQVKWLNMKNKFVGFSINCSVFGCGCSTSVSTNGRNWERCAWVTAFTFRFTALYLENTFASRGEVPHRPWRELSAVQGWYQPWRLTWIAGPPSCSQGWTTHFISLCAD